MDSRLQNTEVAQILLRPLSADAEYFWKSTDFSSNVYDFWVQV